MAKKAEPLTMMTLPAEDAVVPALAVLEGDGRVVFSQKAGEFEDMRHMDAESVNRFLVKWR